MAIGTPTLIRDIADEVAALAHDDGSAGRYVTDGLDLYRLLGPLDVPGLADELVAIEDCHALDVLLVDRRELARWELQPVIAATD